APPAEKRIRIVQADRQHLRPSVDRRCSSMLAPEGACRMTRMEMRRYAMLARVRDFGQAHRDLFPESSVGGQAFATVAAAVAELSDHAVAKMSSAREGIRAKTEARHGLIERLEAIARTAHAIAVDRPGFDDSFRLPRQHSDEALVTIARVFIQDAEAT